MRSFLQFLLFGSSISDNAANDKPGIGVSNYDQVTSDSSPFPLCVYTVHTD